MSAALELPRFEGTPTLSEFDPRWIPYQIRVVNDLRQHFDYSLGAHEVLLSGSVGSAKSILMAHMAVTHVTIFDKSRCCLARRSMPDLKETILKDVLDHMEGDLVEGEDYEHNSQKGYIEFSNGSEIVSKSWADKKFKRFRSIRLSAALVEELTENGQKDAPFYNELYARLGRLPHVPENWIISATNPDAPSHWAYKRFILSKHPLRHVYYSVTHDNPFLGDEYIRSQLENFDPKMARRMIYGEWIEISDEVVYHAYDRANNFRDQEYVWEKRVPIRLSFDFNIGEGKPMSATSFQYLEEKDEFHFAEDYVVQGARTAQLLEEIAETGLFDIEGVHFIIHGDATGRHSDTRSIKSDYDIIREFLSNYETKDGRHISFEIQVPRSNPPIRTRHNRVNGYCKNSLGRNRLFIYRKAAVLDEGMRLVKLKEGGQYIEDDSQSYQHVTTAAGYGVCRVILGQGRKSQTVEL